MLTVGISSKRLNHRWPVSLRSICTTFLLFKLCITAWPVEKFTIAPSDASAFVDRSTGTPFASCACTWSLPIFSPPGFTRTDTLESTCCILALPNL